MTKIIMLGILMFIILAVICAVIVAGRSDEKKTREKGTEEVFLKKRLCPKCKTGKESYERDKSSYACPYISLPDEENCKMFVETSDKE